jgi:TolA-binding protein
MDDTMRFCDGQDEPLKRLMLAMRDERPPAGAANRALVALGVGSAAMLTTSAALGSGGAGATVTKSLAGLALKWLGAGAAVGLVAATGASVLPHAPEEPAPAPAAASAPKPAPVARADRAAAEPGEAANEATQTPAPAATPAPRATSGPAHDPAPAPDLAPSIARFEPPPAADALEREIELLDQARSAVRANRPDAALAKLDHFAREFPRGKLSSEAFVVRLEALMRANRVAEARTLAAAHLTRDPSSPHAARIRRLVGLEAP